MAAKWKKLIFRTQKEAQEARRTLWRMLDEYERVSLFDICRALGKTTNKSIDSCFSWADFGALYVIKSDETHWQLVIQNEPSIKSDIV